jgi:hypothetical protein
MIGGEFVVLFSTARGFCASATISTSPWLAPPVLIPDQIRHPSATSSSIITENPAMVAMVTRSMFASFR